MTTYLRSLFLLAVMALMCVAAAAQDPKTNATPVNLPAATEQPPKDRAAMLKLLGLSPAQLRQLRMINQERKPQMDAAQDRLKDANKALDEAIYADQVNDADIQAKLKAVHEAQADVIRIRSTNELAIRRLLTPDQLTRFRAMRDRFEQAREQQLQQKKALPPGGNVRPPLRPGLQQGPAKPVK